MEPFHDAPLQLTFSSAVRAVDSWCSSDVEPVWDGIDFSNCFRIRILNGYLPTIFISLSLLSILLSLLYTYLTRSYTSSTTPLSPAATRRLSTSSQSRTRQSRDRSLSVTSAHSQSDEIKIEGPQAISEAENEVIMSVVEEESPDLSVKDLLKLGGGAAGVTTERGRGRKGRNGYLRISEEAIAEEEEGEDSEGEESQGRVSFGMLLRAVWGTKKDWSNVLGSAGVLGLLVLRLRETGGDAGGKWVGFIVGAWAWTLLLTLLKLSLSYTSKLTRLANPLSAHHLSPYYTTLEIHIIPWFFTYSFISFFDARTALLHYIYEPTPFDTLTLARESVIFTLAFLLLLIELFAPRASQFSSRSSRNKSLPDSLNAGDLPVAPEMNASLYSILTFSYVSSFMYSAAFPGENDPPISLSTIADLRPDDKTARVLLAYRQDVAFLNSSRLSPGKGKGKKPHGLTLLLFYHFRVQLLHQQLYSYVRVALVALPPLFLKLLLAHINKRSRGESAPMHVAILYAVGMGITQIVSSLAAGQALFVGRRVCIRMRSIVIGEVFTKALRRKDMAGSSVPKDVGEEEDLKKKDKGEKKKEDSEEEDEKASSGKILNLISVDTFRLSEICAYLHFVWPELLLTIIVTVFLLFKVLGLSAAAGVAILVAITPLQALSSKLFYKYQKKLLAAADARLNLATEVIASVRIVKYFAWETKFLEKMSETRAKELAALWARGLTMVVGGILTFGAPVVVSVATFIFHTKILKRDLTAETAFTALALFNILRGPLEGFTDMLVNVLQAHVSLKRIQEFLDEEETAKYATIHQSAIESDPVIGFKGGNFTWSDEQLAKDDASVFRIKDLNLTFPVGKLSIVLGPVGSGKTTLLLSLLGETNRLSGASYLPSPVVRSSGQDPKILTETTAYCSQSPWLLSETVKENILFGSVYNEQRYKDVLSACALEQDLKQFELGDETEVGEKGTVLSGGQKARISLARAIYSPARHILLDDVLSAVDSHTASHLFNECLTGKLMRHRSCVLVTHAVDLCLPGSAFVVSMDNGSIVASGSPDEHLFGSSTLTIEEDIKAKVHKDDGLKAGGVDPMASAITIEALAAGVDDIMDAHEAEVKRARAAKLKLVQDETSSEGAVSAKVYLMYLKAMGGWWLVGVAVGIFILAQLSEIALNLALRYWAGSYDDKEPEVHFVIASIHSSINHFTAAQSSSPYLPTSNFSSFGAGNETTDYWLKMYLLLAGVNLFLYALRMGFFLHRGVVASRSIYTRLMDRILGARIRFFDSTPTGRILNRLSKDMETIDQDVAPVGAFLLLELFGVVGIIGTISVVLPAFLIAAVVITLVYFGIGYVYLASSRELKRSESVSKSPIFSLFGETLNGVATIRAYGDSARFTKQVFSLLNVNNRPFFALWQGNRWLSVRVDVAGALVTFAATIFVLFAVSMDAALAGFILSFAIAFNERILWVVRLWSMMEINANSIERVGEYLELEQESKDGISPPANWPSRDGSIEVEGLTATYSADLPPVLSNVCFKVQPKEKIGIVGRTGSGKSTLGLSFFRFIEPTSGRIVIDGLDINALKLADLRSRLTIVAQESALFAGSLRFNLDPFSAYEDADIWDALRRVQMAAPVGATPRATPGPSRAASIRNGEGSDGGSEPTIVPAEVEERFVVKSLEMVVAEGGKNFSAGQRQLLALARGILKLQSSSILILDESTASLDHATDERIQRTIRDEMQDATILCIAHRLRTIIDYDKILVLGEGKVLEFDTPSNLLAQAESAFADLCRKSGEYEELLEVANEVRDRKN